MTLQQWLSIHPTCAPGYAFAENKDWDSIWEDLERGDWLCFLLDTFFCLGPGQHEKSACIYLCAPLNSGWWVDFQRVFRKKHFELSTPYGALRANFDSMDWFYNFHRLTAASAIPGDLEGMTAAAAYIRERYRPLYQHLAALIREKPSPVPLELGPRSTQ